MGSVYRKIVTKKLPPGAANHYAQGQTPCPLDRSAGQDRGAAELAARRDDRISVEASGRTRPNTETRQAL